MIRSLPCPVITIDYGLVIPLFPETDLIRVLLAHLMVPDLQVQLCPESKLWVPSSGMVILYLLNYFLSLPFGFITFADTRYHSP